MKHEINAFRSDRIRLNFFDLIWLMFGGKMNCSGLVIKGHTMPENNTLISEELSNIREHVASQQHNRR